MVFLDLDRRGSVVVSMSVHLSRRRCGFDTRTRHIMRCKTWLSTSEICISVSFG